MRIHKLLCFLLCLSLLLPLAPDTRAATSSQIQNQMQQLKEQEKELQSKIDALEQQRNDNLTELAQMVEQKQVLDQQIALLNQQVLNTQEQLRALKEAVADQQEACDEASAQYAALHEQYRLRIRAMEEQGNLTYWAVLFSANNFSDFLDRLNMIQEIAYADKVRLDTLRSAAQKLDAEQQMLLEQQSQLQDTFDQLEVNQAQLAEKRNDSLDVLRQLMAQEAEYEALLEEQEAEQLRLAQELANKKSEFDRAVYLEWLASQPPIVPPSTTDKETDKETDSETDKETDSETDKETDKETDTETDKETDSETDKEPDKEEEKDKEDNSGNDTSPALPQIGGWVMPVPPNHVLSSPFGMRPDPFSGKMIMHSGIDLACPEGTHIFAGNGGQVLRAEYSPSMGNYVLIDHGSGYRTVYMHMTHSIVSPGQYVQAGQHIGYVGNTGASRGNHLHYGVSYNGTYINPYNFVYGG